MADPTADPMADPMADPILNFSLQTRTLYCKYLVRDADIEKCVASGTPPPKALKACISSGKCQARCCQLLGKIKEVMS